MQKYLPQSLSSVGEAINVQDGWGSLVHYMACGSRTSFLGSSVWRLLDSELDLLDAPWPWILSLGHSNADSLTQVLWGSVGTLPLVYMFKIYILGFKTLVSLEVHGWISACCFYDLYLKPLSNPVQFLPEVINI